MFALGSHAEIKSSLDAIGTAVALFELDGQGKFLLVSANDTFIQEFDVEMARAQGQPLSHLFPRYMLTQIEAPMQECVEQQRGLESEIAIDHMARTHWWRLIISPIIPLQGRIERVLVTAIDITGKKQLEEALLMSRQRFEAVVNSAYDGILSVNSETRIELINTAACEMFGVGQDVIGKRLDTLMPQRFRSHHDTYFHAFSNSPINSRPMHARASVVGLRRDGSEFPLEVTIAKITLGHTTEMTAIMRDISERAKLVEELKVAATTDPLTGVVNRRRFNEQVNMELNRAQRFKHPLSLLLLDIDHFKLINDTHGHQLGDVALISLVTRLQEQLREVDLLGRWGGEEFIILLPETTLELAMATAERLRIAVESRPHSLTAELAIPMTISIGVSAYHDQGDCADKMLTRADTALYMAKRQGRNRSQEEQ